MQSKVKGRKIIQVKNIYHLSQEWLEENHGRGFLITDDIKYSYGLIYYNIRRSSSGYYSLAQKAISLEPNEPEATDLVATPTRQTPSFAMHNWTVEQIRQKIPGSCLRATTVRMIDRSR